MVRQTRFEGAAIVFGIALWLAQPSVEAFAFTAEPAPSPSVAAPQPKAPPQLVPPPASLGDPMAPQAKPKGTELKIPGIGSVGTLPKLDFGLELLYGSQNAPQSNGVHLDERPQLDQHEKQDDVQIKGTFKHKF